MEGIPTEALEAFKGMRVEIGPRTVTFASNFHAVVWDTKKKSWNLIVYETNDAYSIKYEGSQTPALLKRIKK